MRKVYVSGSISDLARVRQVMAQVREGGHSLTLDWTEFIDGPNPPTWQSAIDQERAAIWESDTFIWLPNPSRPSRGAHVEIGLAIPRPGERRDLVGLSPIPGKPNGEPTSGFYQYLRWLPKSRLLHHLQSPAGSLSPRWIPTIAPAPG